MAPTHLMLRLLDSPRVLVAMYSRVTPSLVFHAESIGGEYTDFHYIF